jgi:cytoskeleton protein RodZ
MDVGATLRHAREERGIALAQVAGSTKISLPNLRAIESNAFDRLPGGLFTRGFLRAYAREVGLGPEEIVRQYVTEYETPEPSAAGDPPDADESHSPGRRPPAVDRRRSDLNARELDGLERRMQRDQILGTAAIFVIGAVVYLMLAQETPRQEMGITVQAPATASGRGASTVGTGGAGTASSPSTTVGQQATLHVELLPQGPCWVSVASDGTPVMQRLMNAGDRATIDAREEAVVRFGDAAACSFSVDGAPAAPAGAAGKPVTLHITRHNRNGYIARGTHTPLAASDAPHEASAIRIPH